ncbi:MAG: conjugal transfer protein TraF, partial [Alphaproteobacteria bacterium]|nr:conjugal transfer protein TraF [Alphaproteobacteria bacterium]
MINFLKILMMTLTALSFSHNAIKASPGFFEKKAEGWHWYEDKPTLQKLESSKTLSPKPALSLETKAPLTPSDILETFKKEVQKKLHLALVAPTYKNVKAYQQIQKQMMDRSERFAQTWMEVVYTTPELDYTVKHPTSQAARHVYLDEERKDMTNLIKDLAKTHGLFFFFKANCSYCHAFAPIVKSFARTYGWQVLAISLDGSQLKEFPQAIFDNGAARTLGVTIVPTLLAVEPKVQTT